MFDTDDVLRSALDGARVRLQDASRALASDAAATGRAAGAALAQSAQAAIFSEALIAAERARFQELKAAAK